jgi:hypothetical protein
VHEAGIAGESGTPRHPASHSGLSRHATRACAALLAQELFDLSDDAIQFPLDFQDLGELACASVR